MKKRHIWVVISIYIVICVGLASTIQTNSKITCLDSETQQKRLDDINEINRDEIPKISTGANYDNLESIFTAKKNHFESNGYFFQIYETSLQATCYALYVLNVTGRLDSINQAEIVSYIMAHYNDSSHIFIYKLISYLLNI